MTRKCVILFCENEHGNGDKTFPDLDSMTTEAIQQAFIIARSVGSLRRDAKKEGWGRVNGGDFCPSCMESM
jgi:hypothetical protein